MSEGQSQAEKIPAEIIATMRRQAGDNERIRVSLGRIIEEMTEEKDIKGLERIRSLYGEEIFSAAVKNYRAS